MKYLSTYLSIIAIILSLVAINSSGLRLGSTIISTNSSDTLETFRTNVNSSLSSLQNDKVSTTTSYNWTELQIFNSGIYSGTASIGATATTTITSAGKVGVGSTTPFGNLSVEQGTETSSFLVANTGSSTPSFIVNGVNGNGRIGIASSSPTEMLSIGTRNATSTISGGYFCGFFTDESGRAMWIKLATSGNNVFSSSTTSCK